jgi:GT2 family glycosyltransferase
MEKITFATNTGPNTLEYTKLLLKSLKENLDSDEHEILVFIDKDNDGTLDYLRSIKKNFKDLKIITHNVKPIVGPERNSNLIVENAKHDIVSYLQSDMVVSKHYDTEILKHLEQDMILSSTRIEPPLHDPSDLTFTMNFGLSPEEFKWDEFISYADKVKSDKIVDHFFAPFTVYKQAWNKLGGYDTNFRRSRCDSDLVQRALHLGIQIKQTYHANVYHFTCVSSRGKNWFDTQDEKAQRRVQVQQSADLVEMRRFFRKWGKFNHTEKLSFKYDIDFVIKSNSPQLVDLAYSIEPFSSRIWVATEEVKNSLLDLTKLEHNYANELYGFESDNWEDSKEYYNHTDYNQIYCVGEPDDYNIKITIDPTKDIQVFLQYITSLREMLEGSEPGDYELGGVEVNVKRLKEIIPSFQVQNPPFRTDLLNLE